MRVPIRWLVLDLLARLLTSYGSVIRLNIPEEAVCFPIDTGSEEEFVGWARGCIIAELQGPQAIDLYWSTCAFLKRAKGSAGSRIEDIDVPIAEITDQQIIAELAKVSRRQGQAPGGVEATTCNETTNQIPIGVEDIDKAMTGTRYIVMLLSILLRKCDVELASDVLDAEGCITLRKKVIGEGAYEFKVRVEHLDSSEAEIGGIEERSRGIGADSQSFVDRALTYLRSIHCQHGMGPVGETRVPAGYCAIFGVKNEDA